MLRVLPWIVDDAADYLQAYIDSLKATGQAVKALEFGTGASTIWLAQRVLHIVSIDHDEYWHRSVAEILKSIGCTNADLHRYDRPYYEHVKNYRDGEFDLIFIDGRDRVKCFENSVRLLRTGGALVLDNAERIGDSANPRRYFEILAYTRRWPCIHFEQQGSDRPDGWLRIGGSLRFFISPRQMSSHFIQPPENAYEPAQTRH